MSLTAEQADSRRGDVQVVRQQFDNGLVSFAIRWWGGGTNVQGTVADSCHFIVFGARCYAHRQDEVIAVLSRTGVKLCYQ